MRIGLNWHSNWVPNCVNVLLPHIVDIVKCTRNYARNVIPTLCRPFYLGWRDVLGAASRQNSKSPVRKCHECQNERRRMAGWNDDDPLFMGCTESAISLDTYFRWEIVFFIYVQPKTALRLHFKQGPDLRYLRQAIWRGWFFETYGLIDLFDFWRRIIVRRTSRFFSGKMKLVDRRLRYLPDFLRQILRGYFGLQTASEAKSDLRI